MSQCTNSPQNKGDSFQFRHCIVSSKELDLYHSNKNTDSSQSEIQIKCASKSKFIVLKNYKKSNSRFFTEAKLQESLVHPNIIRFYGITPDLRTIVMEYAQTGDLKDWFGENSQRDEEKCLEIGRKIALGIAFLHDAGIYHRDLKAENIFMDEDEPKIGDYGHSTKSKTMRSSTPIGTKVYNAPELKKNSCVIGTKELDLYSFGIILWELFCKRNILAFEDALPKFDFPQNFDCEVKEKIELLLSEDPKKRPEAEEMATFFEQKIRFAKDEVVDYEQSNSENLVTQGDDELKIGNLEKAEILYIKAAENSFPPAFIQLALLYSKSYPYLSQTIEHERFKGKAAEYFSWFKEKLKKQENTKPLYFFCWAFCVLEGIGTPLKKSNYPLGIEYLTIAADEKNNYSIAQHYLGRLYCQRERLRAHRDISKAFYYFELASEQGDIYALNQLGALYSYYGHQKLAKPDSTEKDYCRNEESKPVDPEIYQRAQIKSFECYFLAKKNPWACYNLARMFERKRIKNFSEIKEQLSKEEKEPHTYFQKAAELNNEIGFFHLGRILVKDDKNKANEYFSKVEEHALSFAFSQSAKEDAQKQQIAKSCGKLSDFNKIFDYFVLHLKETRQKKKYKSSTPQNSDCSVYVEIFKDERILGFYKNSNLDQEIKFPALFSEDNLKDYILRIDLKNPCTFEFYVYSMNGFCFEFEEEDIDSKNSTFEF